MDSQAATGKGAFARAFTQERMVCPRRMYESRLRGEACISLMLSEERA